MSNFRTKLLGLAAVATAFAGMSYAQITLTTATALVTGQTINTLRAEGETELVTDTQTVIGNASANPVANATVYVSLSALITSKAVTIAGPPASNSEAVLNIGCTAYPAVTGCTTYYGTVSASSVTFSGVSIPAGASTLIVGNVRINASASANPAVTESVLITYPNGPNSATLPGSPAAINVGYILPSLSSLITSTASGTTPYTVPAFTVCTASSITSGSPATQSAASFYVAIRELLAGAFKGPGTFFQGGEGGTFQPVAQTSVGTASTSTEVTVTFSNVPANATIYLAQSVTGSGNGTLTLANTTGVTTIGTVTLDQPYVTFTPSNGVVVATYSVLANQNSTQVGNFYVKTYITLAANSASATTTPITVNVSYAPTGTLTGPATAIPTFSASTNTLNAETISSCNTTLLFPFVTNAAGFETGIAIANTTTDNLGKAGASSATPVTGTCTMNFYGGVATQPAAFTTPAIGATTTTAPTVTPVYAATLTSLSGATNFTGYAIASCSFQDAHGFAYIVDNFGTPSGTSEGYVALVVPNSRTAADGGVGQ